MVDDAVVGVLLGSFDSDFNDNYAFFGFDLPPEPHAFLSQLHVLRTARRSAVGRALIDTYVTEAHHRGCTFVGGSLDLTDAPSVRRGFFDACGFTTNRHDNFGAPVTALIHQQGL